MSNISPLNPSARVLCKLGSVIVHAEELASDDGHELDRIALATLMQDQEVKDWLAAMRGLALIPEKRRNSS